MITRIEYNKALDIVESYHKQLIKDSIILRDLHKTDWKIEKVFVGACTICKYMKANTLKDILRVLENPQRKDAIILKDSTINRAKKSIEEMIRLTGYK